MNFRERLEWMFRVGLLIFVLAAAAFLSAVTAMRFTIQGREVDMPNLVGKSSADAQAILQGRGLVLKVVDRVYSNLPANSVVRQSPPAGETMKISQDAHVVLSLGSQHVTIPSLVGETLRVARIHLLQSGLQLGEITSYTAPNLPADSVLQQTPSPGTLAESPRVDLLVSQTGPQPAYVMPRLMGMPLLDADHMFVSSGLKLAKTTLIPSPQWPKGTVIQQTPDPGSRITDETPIELEVSQQKMPESDFVQ